MLAKRLKDVTRCASEASVKVANALRVSRQVAERYASNSERPSVIPLARRQQWEARAQTPHALRHIAPPERELRHSGPPARVRGRPFWRAPAAEPGIEPGGLCRSSPRRRLRPAGRAEQERCSRVPRLITRLGGITIPRPPLIAVMIPSLPSALACLD